MVFPVFYDQCLQNESPDEDLIYSAPFTVKDFYFQ